MIDRATLQRALAMTTRAVEREHFFGKLTSIDWIRPMIEEGLFTNPPSAVREGDYIQFPPWPELEFVVRVASQAPEQAGDVLLAVPETDNLRIHVSLAEIAATASLKQTVEWAAREAAWIGDQTWLWELGVERLTTVIVRLLDSGEASAAVKLLNALLSLYPDQRGQVAVGEFRVPPRPRAKFDAWEYGRMLAAVVPASITKVGERAFILFMDLLDQALDLSASQDSGDSREDYSFIWRDAIEHGGFEDSDIRDLLVSAVRDAAIELSRSGQFEKVVALLEERRWNTFRRIALNTIRVYDPASALARDRLLSREAFSDSAIHHEYAVLLSDAFPSLEKSDQDTILSWIDAGYDVEASARSHERHTGERPDAALVQSWKEHWQRDRLSPIKDSLPPVWAERYRALVERHGQPVFDFLQHHTSVGFRGEPSPVTIEELRAMEPKAIRELLRDWAPADDADALRAPNREGLNQTLKGLDPDFFLRETTCAEEWLDIGAPFVSTFLTAVTEVIKSGGKVDWRPLLTLLYERARRRSTEWEERWLHQCIAELIERAVDADNSDARPPAEFADKIWNVIDALLVSSEGEEEKAQVSDELDHLTGAINRPSGRALEAAIRFAIWQKNLAPEKHDWHLESMLPSATRVLNAWVDPESATPTETRAIFGVQLGPLVWLDQAWVTAHLDDLFPPSKELAHKRSAVWNTWLMYGQAFGAAVDLFRREYSRAVAELAGAQHTESKRDVSRRLAEHLMAHYWQGRLQFQDKDELLQRFYAEAPVDLLAHAVDFIGRSLRTNDEIPAGVIARLQQLMEARTAAIESIADPSQRLNAAGELVEFGTWFASGKFPVDWSMPMLLRVLAFGRGIEPDHFVAEALVGFAQSRPADVAEALLMMIQSSTEPYSVYAWRDDARRILEVLLKGAPKDRKVAEEAINEALERRLGDFSDLL